jgi:hypothetical protein
LHHTHVVLRSLCLNGGQLVLRGFRLRIKVGGVIERGDGLLDVNVVPVIFANVVSHLC